MFLKQTVVIKHHFFCLLWANKLPCLFQKVVTYSLEWKRLKSLLNIDTVRCQYIWEKQLDNAFLWICCVKGLEKCLTISYKREDIKCIHNIFKFNLFHTSSWKHSFLKTNFFLGLHNLFYFLKTLNKNIKLKFVRITWYILCT